MNANGSDFTEYRRSLVASLLLRKPNITRRKLCAAVGEQIRNPKTGEPFSLATIHNDVVVLKEEWKEKAAADIEDWIADELAKLDEIEGAAWTTGHLDTVLKCMMRRAKLLGLDKPEKREIDGKIKADVTHGISLDGLSDEELDKLAGIAKRLQPDST